MVSWPTRKLRRKRGNPSFRIVYIITEHSGQLCNWLFSLLPVLAAAEHYGTSLVILFSTRKYAEFFPELKNRRNIKFWLSKEENAGQPLFERITNDLARALGYQSERDIREHSPSGLVFINGWSHRHDKSFIIERKESIRRIFKPKDDAKGLVEALFHDYNGITVGVHVRRGDYRVWKQGKYFFEDEVYLRAMRQFKGLLEEGFCRPVRFFLCSDESLTIQAPDLDVVSSGVSDPIVDLYSLSRCDYIIGPPSTFSQWASFYGDVPISFIVGKFQQIHLEDFSPVVLLDCQKRFFPQRNDWSW